MQYLLNDVDPDWVRALEPVHSVLSSLESFLDEEASSDKQVLPSRTHIMRSFQAPMRDVRVLIVGQDPYPTAGHAVGLSFSVAPEVALPRSLGNIFTELVSDLGCSRPTTGDLTPWTDQGVMLLNRVLTVREGEAGSHHGKGWESVTACAVKALVARGMPLVAILWGRQAQSLKVHLGATPCVMSAHPSPLSASQGFFGSRPFSSANTLLAEQGASPIRWCLG